MQPSESYRQPGALIDSDHPSIQAFAQAVTAGARSDRERAVKIYYAVRDGWRYNPYRISLQPGALRASAVFERVPREGHCLDKGILMIALLRSAGIPARLCLAKVRNHIAAERMTEAFGTGVLAPHGYVEVWLEGRWIKATPAFNRTLCERLHVHPLDFDGHRDSIFQEFDRAGGAFMEYLEEYGHFEDVPEERIKTLLFEHYPGRFEEGAVVDLR